MQAHFYPSSTYHKLKVVSVWLLVILWSVFGGFILLNKAFPNNADFTILPFFIYAISVVVSTLFLIGLSNMGYIVLHDEGGYFQDFFRKLTFRWNKITHVEVKTETRGVGYRKIRVRVLALTFKNGKTTRFAISQLEQEDLLIEAVRQMVGLPEQKRDTLSQVIKQLSTQKNKKMAFWKNYIILLLIGVLAYYGAGLISQKQKTNSAINAKIISARDLITIKNADKALLEIDKVIQEIEANKTFDANIWCKAHHTRVLALFKTGDKENAKQECKKLFSNKNNCKKLPEEPFTFEQCDELEELLY